MREPGLGAVVAGGCLMLVLYLAVIAAVVGVASLIVHAVFF